MVAACKRGERTLMKEYFVEAVAEKSDKKCVHGDQKTGTHCS